MSDVPAGQAYGFAWRSSAPLDALVQREHELPAVALLEVSADQSDPIPVATVEPSRAVLVLSPAFSAEVQRAPATVVVRSRVPAEDQLVHPILSRPASLLARWHGDEAFHAGAFVLDGGAWAILGSRGAGKSTLMAILDRIGRPVVADDLLVVRGGQALIGPRVADLRPESAERLELLTEGVLVRVGQRHRIGLSSCADALPLRGWVALDWGTGIGLERLSAEEALRQVARERLWGQLASDNRAVLELAGLPAYRFWRPRDWARAHEHGRTLVALLAG